MDKEELRKEFYTIMEYSEPFGNEYHDELFNWMWSKIEQNSHKHSVSGKRPTPDIDKLLHDFAVECGYSDEFHLCAMSENISTEHMKQFALYYQAACASGAVDTKPAREVCIKGGERLENGECAKCNLLWGKCCAELL